ncbi:hypothetical protein Prudu_891S000200 [Prunus dulcis]|uniref:Uncharacterized protein n=1 Tax=Prunus dulcis TaxID=3755 RepID=A0A5H2XMM2_PRUDU|nr:hypothetical protein Prudu_891S000200 [Prunus dulcis]
MPGIASLLLPGGRTTRSRFKIPLIINNCSKIKAGSIYEITHFHTGRNKPSHKVVPHVAQLFFNARTTFKELPTIHPHIPQHRFYLMFLDALLEYNHWNKKWWAMRGLRINVKSASKISGKIVLNSSVSTLIFINPDIQELAAYKTMFKVSLVLEDSTDETNAIIIGRPAEQLFRISCNELVVQRGFTD